MNPTVSGGTTGTTTGLVPLAPGLKNSVNICGDTTSISLAEAELSGGLGAAEGTSLAGTGTVASGKAVGPMLTMFVLEPAAFSVELVGAGGGRRMAGRVKEIVAVLRENRSGVAPTRCK